MLLLAATALVWVAPLIWLMRLADREIRAAQELHVDLPPKVAREDEGKTGAAKLLVNQSAERSEGECAGQDADRLQHAA